MKKSVLIGSILVIGIVLGCTNDDVLEAISLEGPYYALDGESREYLPFKGKPSLVFVNGDGQELQLNALEGMQVDTVWNYNEAGKPRLVYSEFRRLRFTANHTDGRYLQILIDLTVDQSEAAPYGFYDVLRVSFWGQQGQTRYPLDFKLMTSKKGNAATETTIPGTQTPKFLSEVTLLGRDFEAVHWLKTDEGLELYYSKGTGLIAFKDFGGLWVLKKVAS